MNDIKVLHLTFRAFETRVLSILISDNLLKFIKILKTHFCLKFTILQLFMIMDQNQSAKSRTLKRLQVGGLPLIHAIAKRMRLKEILYKYIPAHGNEDIPAVETLMLLVYNLILGKDPLYELQEWVESIDFRCIYNEDYENVKFNDDRFGRVLNKLYLVDRASLMTELVVFFVKEFNIALERLSNDSKSIKAFGRYPGKTKTGLKLKKGQGRPGKNTNMFGFFIALAVQALIEREVRNKMKEQKIEKIRVYPEQREASHPTTCKIINRFDSICTYKIMENSKVVETFKDSLNEDQKLILGLLNIEEDEYWKSAS